jgi:hypothetical protein
LPPSAGIARAAVRCAHVQQALAACAPALFASHAPQDLVLDLAQLASQVSRDLAARVTEHSQLTHLEPPDMASPETLLE